MALFGKKAEDSSAPIQRAETPVEEVRKLREQGLTNNQIVQTLQREGYKTFQIFDAMNQADQYTGAPIEEPPSLPKQPQEPQSPPEMQDNEFNFPSAQQQQSAPEPRQSYNPSPSFDDNRTEEIVEAIVDEKWNELLEDVEKIVKWKNQMEQRIVTVEKRFEDLKGNFENLQTGLLGKMREYDSNVQELGTDIKAMEKVFEKVIPAFTENVNQLSRITKNLKKKK